MGRIRSTIGGIGSRAYGLFIFGLTTVTWLIRRFVFFFLFFILGVAIALVLL